RYLSCACGKASASKSTAIITLLHGEFPCSLLTVRAGSFGVQRNMPGRRSTIATEMLPGVIAMVNKKERQPCDTAA
ncbi:hypothetical protein, partial [Klebsiella pneumoniae]|uniref:hypothetical protein n=2 Tax=Klebsiella pneumoniae TaxID=573 RepID=UPI001D026E03